MASGLSLVTQADSIAAGLRRRRLGLRRGLSRAERQLHNGGPSNSSFLGISSASLRLCLTVVIQNEGADRRYAACRLYPLSQIAFAASRLPALSPALGCGRTCGPRPYGLSAVTVAVAVAQIYAARPMHIVGFGCRTSATDVPLRRVSGTQVPRWSPGCR